MMQTALPDCYMHDAGCVQYGGRTALMYAVGEGNYDIAKYLIQNGADKKIKDSKGNIALDYLLNKVFVNSYPKQYMFTQYTKEPTDPKTLMSLKEFEELQLLLN